MGSDGNGVSGRVTASADIPVPAQKGVETVPSWDRFAHWSPRHAQLGLLAFLLLLVAFAFVPVKADRQDVSVSGFAETLDSEQIAPVRKRDDDLALYDIAIERIQAGEHYYDFIVEEQRASGFPLKPGIAVRLPTLAYIDAWLGETGQGIAAFALMLAVLAAWWGKLGEEPGGRRFRLIAMAFLFVAASLGLNRYFFTLHELWSGMLLALAFGLHRVDREKGGKWVAALAVAALAVAIREHALPFVLLMGALAFWRRDWKEGAAWSALAVAFLIYLAVHLNIIAQDVLPGDREGKGWLYMRGLSGWVYNIALSSNLRYLPEWLAGPALVLMLFGWSAWRTSAGVFGLLLFLGYGLVFMIAGRPDNYYWGAMVAPVMFIGFALVPMGLRSLIQSAQRKESC